MAILINLYIERTAVMASGFLPTLGLNPNHHVFHFGIFILLCLVLKVLSIGFVGYCKWFEPDAQFMPNYGFLCW